MLKLGIKIYVGWDRLSDKLVSNQKFAIKVESSRPLIGTSNFVSITETVYYSIWMKLKVNMLIKNKLINNYNTQTTQVTKQPTKTNCTCYLLYFGNNDLSTMIQKHTSKSTNINYSLWLLLYIQVFVIWDIIVHTIVLQNFFGYIDLCVYYIAHDETQKHIINTKTKQNQINSYRA